MLTKRQHDLLVFLDQQIRDTGVCPSFEEIAAAMGIKSKSNVSWLLKALQRRGFVRRIPGKARSVDVIRMPGQPDPRPPHQPNDVAEALRVTVITLSRLSRRGLLDQSETAVLDQARLVIAKHEANVP